MYLPQDNFTLYSSHFLEAPYYAIDEDRFHNDSAYEYIYTPMNLFDTNEETYNGETAHSTI